MARRYHEIKGLAEFTAKTIVSSEEDFKKFLHTAEFRKASEPKVEYGSKISEPRTEYSAKKPEKPDRASTKPFHDKLEAKKGEVAKQSPPKPAEVKDKHTSL